MAKAEAKEFEDPAYMSCILQKVFTCELYRELRVQYICSDGAFQEILTRHELEILTLENKTNTIKQGDLRSIATKRWTFDDFEIFLDVLKKDHEHIEQAMRQRYKKEVFLTPCLPVVPIRPHRKTVPARKTPAMHPNMLKRPVSYQHLDEQMQTFPKVLEDPPAPVAARIIDRYPMKTRPRGMAMVISNEEFTHLTLREGSQKDKEKLAELFKFLDYKVLFMNNLTASEMTRDLQRFARDRRLAKVSAIIIVILTHGMGEGVLFGKDGQVFQSSRGIEPVEGTFITKDELQQLFSSTSCPHMGNKPKGFILQACRGVDVDCSERAGSGSSLQSEHPPEGQMSRPFSAPKRDREDGAERISKTGDFLFAYSSTSGFKAYRQPKIGSPFIHRLCQLIMELGRENHFEDILKELRKTFQVQLANGIYMMPESSGTLMSNWFFEPPLS